MARRAELWLVVAAVAACGKHDRAPAAAARARPPVPLPHPPAVRPVAPPVRPLAQSPIAVPRVRAPIAIDGEWGPDWNDRAARVIFHVTGGTAEVHPYSEMRFLRDGDALLVGLYAADEDIYSTEFFDVAIGAFHAHADAGGKITPPASGVKAAVDLDGTRDKPGDWDEEWKVELSIPLAAIAPADAGAAVPVHVSRCDTPKDTIERCGEWTGTLAPVASWPAQP